MSLLLTGCASAAAQTSPAPAPPPAAIEAEKQFMEKAVQRVLEYRDTFKDLTADETRSVELYDRWGSQREKRSTVASLVIYRSQNDASRVTEYRDVYQVDGKEVKNHQERAIKLWERLSKAKSIDDELRKIDQEGDRYNNDVQLNGFTLDEGLPLRPSCGGDFRFREIGTATMQGRLARVFDYTQVKPCKAVFYQLGLPGDLDKADKWHRGRLWIDAETARLLAEVRDVYVTVNAKKELEARIAHFEFEYAPSAFDLMLPVRILVEGYRYPRTVQDKFVFGICSRVRQAYGPFSRFQVTVNEKVSSPAAPAH